MAKTEQTGNKTSEATMSNRKCFTCGKFIETGKIRTIKAFVPMAGNPFRSTQQTHLYCADCYSKATSTK
jgi:hypothetical protein